MTKIIFLLAISMLLINCKVQDQKLTDTEKIQIKTEVGASFDSLVESTKVQDWEAYFAHFDQNNFTGLNADGTIWESFEDFKASVIPGFQMIASSDSLIFPVVKISLIDKNTAVLINEYEQKITLNGGQEIRVAGGGVQVWSRNSGKWKLVSISASSKQE
ncbi:MAG: nuclear transport factor 2 family protein [Balneola sp.]|nr:nuclear transport factor 2 family protein [Balneola sp.]MBO6649955.1 nuclear transport factor 2 family protein [Balneola sp.]MBO6711697.1 nuclear transport factor 2 family protein [Balneola sp.]MBO6799891.1 nuclear transport factor 2 family protein [Balneola sp.]MBO6871136.1 nuclear transport factor 2 family protein [Balneola sp.]